MSSHFTPNFRRGVLRFALAAILLTPAIRGEPADDGSDDTSDAPTDNSTSSTDTPDSPPGFVNINESPESGDAP